MNFLFKNKQYSFQMLRAIAATAGGGADIGECLATAGRITEGDDQTWYQEWMRTAQRRERAGDEFLGQGDAVGAMVYSNSTILNWLDKAFLSLQAPETP